MRLKSFVLLVLAVCCAAIVVVAQDGGAPVSQGAVVNTSSPGAPSLDGMGVKKYLLGRVECSTCASTTSRFNGPLVSMTKATAPSRSSRLPSAPFPLRP